MSFKFVTETKLIIFDILRLKYGRRVAESKPTARLRRACSYPLHEISLRNCYYKFLLVTKFIAPTFLFSSAALCFPSWLTNNYTKIKSFLIFIISLTTSWDFYNNFFFSPFSKFLEVREFSYCKGWRVMEVVILFFSYL